MVSVTSMVFGNDASNDSIATTDMKELRDTCNPTVTHDVTIDVLKASKCDVFMNSGMATCGFCKVNVCLVTAPTTVLGLSGLHVV